MVTYLATEERRGAVVDGVLLMIVQPPTSLRPGRWWRMDDMYHCRPST